MVQGMESIENMRSRGYRVILVADNIFYCYHNDMQTAGFTSLHSFNIQPIGRFQGLFVIYLHKGIEMGETPDPFEIMQNCIPAGQGALIQGLLVFKYGSKGKQ